MLPYMFSVTATNKLIRNSNIFCLRLNDLKLFLS